MITITEHLRERVVLWTRAQVGKPYVNGVGSTGPTGFDCSGLTLAGWATVGVAIPHNAGQQADYHANAYVTQVPYTPTNAARLQFSDLVFYYVCITHVALYNGARQVVQATDPAHGVELIGVEQYAVPVALGFMGHQ